MPRCDSATQLYGDATQSTKNMAKKNTTRVFVKGFYRIQGHRGEYVHSALETKIPVFFSLSFLNASH